MVILTVMAACARTSSVDGLELVCNAPGSLWFHCLEADGTRSNHKIEQEFCISVKLLTSGRKVIVQ